MSTDDAPVLRAVEEPTSVASGEPGLESLRTILGRVAADHTLQSITVVVDDADLGRQAFRAGPGPHAALDSRAGVHVLPAEATTALDALAVHALCAASLRAAVLDGVVRGIAGPELELRRLDGVFLVEMADGAEPVLEVAVTSDAPDDVARVALDTLRRTIGTSVAIVIERLSGVRSDTTDETAPPDAESADRPELLAVHTTSETREIEVHVAYREARAVGRAPMAGGLAAAVEAALGALRDVGVGKDLRVGWARTVDTTIDPSFVVTVALNDDTEDEPSYGAAAGASPVEAAARATLLAASRA